MAKLPRAGRPLTAKEQAIEAVQQLEETDEQRLQHLEQVIDVNLKAFYEVGCALREIRDKKLYKLLGYNSFESYCVARWDMHQAHAKRLQAASTVIDNLKSDPSGITFLPASERQVRPLVRLEPEQQLAAWRKVMESAELPQKITSDMVVKTVSALLGKGDKEQVRGKRLKLQLAEDLDDLLENAYRRLRRLAVKAEGVTITKERVAEIVLKKILGELEKEGDNSPTAEQLLNLLK